MMLQALDTSAQHEHVRPKSQQSKCRKGLPQSKWDADPTIFLTRGTFSAICQSHHGLRWPVPISYFLSLPISDDENLLINISSYANRQGTPKQSKFALSE